MSDDTLKDAAKKNGLFMDAPHDGSREATLKEIVNLAKNASEQGVVFPQKYLPSEGPSARTFGLLKRELFAATAMQGLVRNLGFDGRSRFDEGERIAKASVAYADALIAELAKKPEAPCSTG